MNRKAFSMLELVFVIVILGTISTVAISKLILSREDACYAKLRAGLSEVETSLTREWTRKFLQGVAPTTQEITQVLKTLEQNNSDKCTFKVTDPNNITATVGRINIAFKVADDKNTKSPVITCDVNNATCAKIVGKAKP